MVVPPQDVMKPEFWATEHRFLADSSGEVWPFGTWFTGRDWRVWGSCVCVCVVLCVMCFCFIFKGGSGFSVF